LRAWLLVWQARLPWWRSCFGTSSPVCGRTASTAPRCSPPTWRSAPLASSRPSPTVGPRAGGAERTGSWARLDCVLCTEPALHTRAPICVCVCVCVLAASPVRGVGPGDDLVTRVHLKAIEGLREELASVDWRAALADVAMPPASRARLQQSLADQAAAARADAVERIGAVISAGVLFVDGRGAALLSRGRDGGVADLRHAPCEALLCVGCVGCGLPSPTPRMGLGMHVSECVCVGVGVCAWGKATDVASARCVPLPPPPPNRTSRPSVGEWCGLAQRLQAQPRAPLGEPRGDQAASGEAAGRVVGTA
jgi:hypothetical protein